MAFFAAVVITFQLLISVVIYKTGTSVKNVKYISADILYEIQTDITQNIEEPNEGPESVTFCHQLKLPAKERKKYAT